MAQTSDETGREALVALYKRHRRPELGKKQ